jgi:hypothetical protein
MLSLGKIIILIFIIITVGLLYISAMQNENFDLVNSAGVDLKNVNTLTFQQDEYTNGRRTKPIKN